jgi:hypothetical protein
MPQKKRNPLLVGKGDIMFREYWGKWGMGNSGTIGDKT